MHEFDIILLDKVLGYFLISDELFSFKVSNIKDKMVNTTCFKL